MKHLGDGLRGTGDGVDCGKDAVGSLVEMFVGIVEKGRIAKGQCPALRPVFLKPHGVTRGLFRVRQDIPTNLKIGLFAGSEYPAWVRFSSDTLPTVGDFKTTLGIAIKLFGVPGDKIFGRPEDTTFDFILQNAEVFFVDAASDMCAFTKAGVIDGDYGAYIEAHPRTATLLNEMAKPVASVLASPYWSCVPFKFGEGRFVKYKLEPALSAEPPTDAPANPTYLAADLERRLKAGDALFRFYVQFSADPKSMPLDEATVRWDEAVSPPIHVADVILDQQDIAVRGQDDYGENLSWNIWRVTKEHAPVGSISEARRAVYDASAQIRRDANGVPDGEPSSPRTATDFAPCVDTEIVRAAIHPAIGIARIGDSATEHFIGPEIDQPAGEKPGFYRDASGALKRQAARFRIYGYNAAGSVVRELTCENADIQWTVHLANRKPQWYRFMAALDIPEAVAMKSPRRNAQVTGLNRDTLAIDPGPRTIAGKSVSGGANHTFDTGAFKGATVVSLGEIRTDGAGRLLVLGGTGKSASPSNAPVYNGADEDSFNNADDWYDDTSDGPISASVSITGRAIPVEDAWAVVAPPNYAPDIIGWRTLYDLLVDVYVGCGWMEVPQRVSFADHILPILRRLSNLQWVNKGFATMFGRGCPMDFNDDRLIAKLSAKSDPKVSADPYRELRRIIFNMFRPPKPVVAEPVEWPHVFPWIYGDAYGSFPRNGTGNMLTMTSVQMDVLSRWAKGDFEADWPRTGPEPKNFADVPLSGQPAMLDRAALHFCLADTFHPGCELTWPMRHSTLYSKPFRIRRRAPGESEPDYGAKMTQDIALRIDGPLHAQRPGDLTRWMALPWQGDTAFCRSGYERDFDPYVPTFWPARVPNQVLTVEDYEKAIDTSLSRAERIKAYNNREHWMRGMDKQGAGDVAGIMMVMVQHFSAAGLVEARKGVVNDPDLPETMFVETVHAAEMKAALLKVQGMVLADTAPSKTTLAGWISEQHYQDFRRVRVRSE